MRSCVRLTCPPGATGRSPIRARLDWLACTDKVCVPEQGEVALDLPAGGAGDATRASTSGAARCRGRSPAPARFATGGRPHRDRASRCPPASRSASPISSPPTTALVDYAAPQTLPPQRRHADRQPQAPGAARRRRLSGRARARRRARAGDRSACPARCRRGGRTIGELGAQRDPARGARRAGRRTAAQPDAVRLPDPRAQGAPPRPVGRRRARRRGATRWLMPRARSSAPACSARCCSRSAPGGSAAGWAFQLQDPRTILLLLLLATGDHAQPAARVRAAGARRRARPGGSFGTGALAAFVATPCAGPFLGAALGTALLLPAGGVGAGVRRARAGAGAAVPAVAFVPALRRRLPQPGAVDGAAPALPRHPDGGDRGRLPVAAVAAGRRRRRWLVGPCGARRAGAAAVVGRAGASGAAHGRAVARWSRRWSSSPVLRSCSFRNARRPAARVPLGAAAWSEAAVARELRAGHARCSSISPPTGA